MQVNELTSIKIKSPYFCPSIFKDGDWIFYNEKSKCHFQNGDKKFTLPIKKSCSCVFFENKAYVINEEGSLYEVNLDTKQYLCLQTKLGTDTVISKAFNNKLFVSQVINEFYRTGYFLENGKLVQVKNLPETCQEIFEYKGNIYFRVSDKKRNSLYKCQVGSEDIICCFENNKCTDFSNIDFENSHFAYYDYKSIKIFDYSENLISKIKCRKRVNKMGFICNGKYLIVSIPKQILIMDSQSLTILQELTYNNETYNFYPSVEFNYTDTSFCATLENDVILYEIQDN